MNTTMIIGVVVIVAIAAAAYMFMSGNLPIAVPSIQAATETSTAEMSNVDDAAATLAATDAESAVAETAEEISSADALEIPDV